MVWLGGCCYQWGLIERCCYNNQDQDQTKEHGEVGVVAFLGIVVVVAVEALKTLT